MDPDKEREFAPLIQSVLLFPVPGGPLAGPNLDPKKLRFQQFQGLALILIRRVEHL